MKTLLFTILFIPLFASAQKLVPMDDATTSTTTSETDYVSPNTPTSYKNNTPRVQQTIGQVYTQEQLMNMPRTDVNGIANTVAGVNSQANTNSIPNIRGADASGTAYYVDGVRVYGALPVLVK